MQNFMKTSGMILVLATVLSAESLSAGDISVSGNMFLRDGEPWEAEGVVLTGLVSPTAQREKRPAFAKAFEMFGPNLLQDVRDYGADLIRFQFSQGGLDPQSEIYDPAYRDEVLDAVKLVRDEDFNVIVSMQWQGPSGLRDDTGLPSATTNRAWLQIIDELRDDAGIMLEVFNEPMPGYDRTEENWEIWRSSMQDLIYLLRGAGSKNVLLIGGPAAEHYIGGAPKLTDPLDSFGYAIHPYLSNSVNRRPSQWDANFGDFAKTHPVMATEFSGRADTKGCRDDLPQRTEKLLDYLHERKIGLVLWAFDMPVTWVDGELSSFENFKCSPKSTNGAGQIVHEYFMSK